MRRKRRVGQGSGHVLVSVALYNVVMPVPVVLAAVVMYVGAARCSRVEHKVFR